MGKKYRVWCPEYHIDEDNAAIEFAYSAASAAEYWAERRDRDSTTFRIANGQAMDVFVCGFDRDAKTECFSVSGMAHPVYTAVYCSKTTQP